MRYNEGVTTVTKQVIVSVKDLRFATIACANCNTRVTLDFERNFTVNEGPSFITPPQCPRCGARYDSAIVESVGAMQRIHKSLAELGHDVTFSVSEEKPPA